MRAAEKRHHAAVEMHRDLAVTADDLGERKQHAEAADLHIDAAFMLREARLGYIDQESAQKASDEADAASKAVAS